VANEIRQIITADASGFVRGTAQAEKALGSLQNEFKSFQTTAAGALSFAGIGLGTAEIIQLADTYGQLTAKIKLVTQYSGDFAQVQQGLRDSAKASRSDLGATVDLYTQLGPALKGIGLSSKESISVLTTINKAIALSGASSEASKAALVQLAQGFASGALRGEELNSVMEQTPALAQAIADGLGVSRGALRDMGADGKLTAEVVATALRKVADQVNGDFAQMPITVGQAFTNLRNEFMVFVGAVDSSSGTTSALANTINAVAEEFQNAGPAVTAFSTAIKIMVDGLDGGYRLLKIMGTGLAGYTAAAMLAITGDIKGARQVLREMGSDVAAILEKPLLTEPKVVSAQADSARKRKQLELQLADEVVKLEQLKAYEAGKQLDNIAAKEKTTVDARIADQKRLVEAVRTGWQDSLKEVEKYAEAAKEKLQKASDYRDAGKTAAFNASISGLTPEEQVAAKQQRMSDLQGQGSYESARARMAALEGDVKKYDAASVAAEKRLKEALSLAEQINDVASIESISNDLAKIQEAGAALDTKKGEEAKARAESQAKLLNDLQAQLAELEKKARSIEIQIDVQKAESTIAGIKKQLEEIQSKTITITVNQVGSPEAIAAAKQSATTEPVIPTGFAAGGFTGPGGKYQVAGLVHAGEYVHRQEVVRQPGALEFLRRFNQVGMAALKGYASGGLVTRLQVPAAAQPASSESTLYGNFYLDGQRHRVQASRETFDSLAEQLAREAMKKGRRG
jgi:tape measure domain-containing protein